uniref:Uncharacterized protein n=1 Tax=Arundo donax TaxID=35708 RepID=A0A0A9A3R0_ARUDO
MSRLQREPALRAVLPAGGGFESAAPAFRCSGSQGHAEGRFMDRLEHGAQRGARCIGGSQFRRRGVSRSWTRKHR